MVQALVEERQPQLLQAVPVQSSQAQSPNLQQPLRLWVRKELSWGLLQEQKLLLFTLVSLDNGMESDLAVFLVLLCIHDLLPHDHFCVHVYVFVRKILTKFILGKHFSHASYIVSVITIFFTESVSPRTGSKVAVALPKGRSQLQAKLSKTSSLQSHAGGSAENLHAKTSARKSLPPSASKPPPSYPNKVNGVRTKVGRVSTVGAITHTTSMSRGLQRAKGSSAGTSASSLTDEDTADSDYRSVPFRSLEPANGSDVTPSCDSERCNDSGVYECDGITFPDAVIQNPDSCTLFPVLAHRVRKWKIFGRYLGLSDSELDIIESSNHFTTERCLKMLVHWGKKHRGKYSELEASLHNIMREDLIEDVRPYLPSGRAQQCSPVEEENGHLLKFSGFKVEGGSPNIHKLAATVSEFVKRSSECSKILLHFSHAKLYRPIVLYLPFSTSSSRDCDLTVVEELCFAAWMRSASIVDLVFEIK